MKTKSKKVEPGAPGYKRKPSKIKYNKFEDLEAPTAKQLKLYPDFIPFQSENREN